MPFFMGLYVDLPVGGGNWTSVWHFCVSLYSLTPPRSDLNHPCSRQWQSSKAEGLHQDRRFSRELFSGLLCIHFICEANTLVLIIRMRAVIWHSENKAFKLLSLVSFCKICQYSFTQHPILIQKLNLKNS